MFYKIEKIKHSKVTYLNKKRNTQRKLSRSYHLIMSILYLFHFIASIKIWPQLDCKYS